MSRATRKLLYQMLIFPFSSSQISFQQKNKTKKTCFIKTQSPFSVQLADVAKIKVRTSASRGHEINTEMADACLD